MIFLKASIYFIYDYDVATLESEGEHFVDYVTQYCSALNIWCAVIGR